MKKNGDCEKAGIPILQKLKQLRATATARRNASSWPAIWQWCHPEVAFLPVNHDRWIQISVLQSTSMGHLDVKRTCLLITAYIFFSSSFPNIIFLLIYSFSAICLVSSWPFICYYIKFRSFLNQSSYCKPLLFSILTICDLTKKGLELF